MTMSQRVQPGRSIAVKNKAPASVQITAEQILREAMERVAAEPKAPKTKITDPEELEDYRLERRKGFEDNIRRQRTNIGAWTKYALWEASQMEFDRARSIFERALEVDYRNQTLWLKYAELEMKNKFINSGSQLFRTWSCVLQLTCCVLVFVQLETFGIVRSLCCHAWTNSGTSMRTWKKCLGMSTALGRSLSVGCRYAGQRPLHPPPPPPYTLL